MSIAAAVLTFIVRPHPASMGWILSVWLSGSIYTVALISFLHASWNSLVCWKLALSAKITFSWSFFLTPEKKCIVVPLQVYCSIHPCILLKIYIHPFTVVFLLQKGYISFSSRHELALRSGLLQPLYKGAWLLAFFQNHMKVVKPTLISSGIISCPLVHYKWKRYLAHNIPVFRSPSSIFWINGWSISPPLCFKGAPQILVELLNC